MEPYKAFYSMQEVQEMTSLPASTLRFWEKEFEQLSPRKDKHGNRYYTLENIQLIKQIKYIRDELKITRLDAIRNELKQSVRPVDQRTRVAELLGKVRDELLRIRAEI